MHGAEPESDVVANSPQAVPSMKTQPECMQQPHRLGDRPRALVPWPRWIDEIGRLLPIRSQFVIYGSVRDVFLAPVSAEPRLASLIDCLWAFLESAGFECIVVFDRVDGITVHPATRKAQDLASQLLSLTLVDGVMATTNLDSLIKIAGRVVHAKSTPIALLIDFASRLTANAQAPDSLELKFYAGMEKLSLSARPRGAPGPDRAPRSPAFNTAFWIVNRANDMPPWFTLDSERVGSIAIPKPDFDSRLRASELLAREFPGFDRTAADDRRKAILRLADSTDGMSLQSLVDIAKLARHQGIELKEVDDAIRCFRVGATENFWRKGHLRHRILSARDHIETRVKGQHQAVTKTLDILMRSVMGMTGAHTRSSGGRPRGVLFFAGPTGVGKTELAKTLTQLLFGDERSYIRFDMSEFSEEHTAARLLGAPPGYIGYAGGGELTNAVTQRPFSVILFDEIEKCHPRVLDKFLQILEDGRLTDGQGRTSYFTESVIIFTSNLGTYRFDDAGRRIQNVKPEDPYELVESRIRGAIENHFKYELSRPELLNRIGDNIVVFNQISPVVAREILTLMLENIVDRVRDEHKVSLVIPTPVRERIAELCTSDLSLGGRGVGNALESVLVNPLSRALFEYPFAGKSTIAITSITEKERIYTVDLA